jgi:uncharacterized protein YraI
MKLHARFVVAVLLATPAAALAAPGMINASVNLRAGPSVEFPVVDRIRPGVPVEVHGCIREALWCDVSTERERGWVAAQYLDYLYGDRYVDLPSYVDVVDVPATSFVLTSYWSSFYVGRPWYRRHVWWNRHWTAQTAVASRTLAAQPVAPSAQGGHGMTSAGPGITAKGVAMGRGLNGAAAGAQGASVQAMRGGGVPIAARAQLGGGSRGGLGGGGFPHAAMGGAPQAGGTMHNAAGGGSRDSGGGHHRH